MSEANTDPMIINPSVDFLSLVDAGMMRLSGSNGILVQLLFDDHNSDLAGPLEVIQRQVNEASAMIDRMWELYKQVSVNANNSNFLEAKS